MGFQVFKNEKPISKIYPIKAQAIIHCFEKRLVNWGCFRFIYQNGIRIKEVTAHAGQGEKE